jgi:hypothetical protein
LAGGHVFHTRCVWCGARHDRASNAEPNETRPPVDGDVTMCFVCGEWLVFDGGQLRAPTTAEYDEIAAGKAFRRARAAWLAVVDRQAGARR